ncbi:RICIN domain-containing protein [Streptomyces sp. NPDC057543]|uniref:RICIN domain-containing protein n=1 Tax=Streptomyces sp. NPDC057543 TaxID=3346163 RepID=UPI0036A55C25
MRSSSKARRVLTVLGLAATAMVPLTAAQASPAVDRQQASEYVIRTFDNKCLTVPSPDDGAPITQFDCDDRFFLRFRIVAVGGGQYEIRTFADKCLDVKDRSPADGAPIIQWSCNGGPNQRFRMVQTPDGYEIRTFADKCLDVKDRSPANGTPIIEYGCDGAPNQRFTIERRL